MAGAVLIVAATGVLGVLSHPELLMVRVCTAILELGMSCHQRDSVRLQLCFMEKLIFPQPVRRQFPMPKTGKVQTIPSARHGHRVHRIARNHRAPAADLCAHAGAADQPVHRHLMKKQASRVSSAARPLRSNPRGFCSIHEEILDHISI